MVPVRRVTSGRPGKAGLVMSAVTALTALTEVGPSTRFSWSWTLCRPGASCTEAERAVTVAVAARLPSTRISKPPITPPGVLTDQETLRVSRTT